MAIGGEVGWAMVRGNREEWYHMRVACLVVSVAFTRVSEERLVRSEGAHSVNITAREE